MSGQSRKLEWGKWGVLNPDGHRECGAKDYMALLPEPIHWGGCKECMRRIKAALAARLPAASPAKPAEQTSFDFMEDQVDGRYDAKG